MGMVCAQPKGYGDDYLKRVNIRIQTVFKLDVAACLVVVQHVRFEDGFDGGVHCRDTRVEQSGDFSGGHPYIVTVTLTALSSMMIMSRFMASLF